MSLKVKVQQRFGGDWVGRERVRLKNRTGDTLSKGDVVALDLTGSDEDVNTFAVWSADSDAALDANPLANAIGVATAHLSGWVFAAALEEIDDDEIGNFLFSGIERVEVAGNDAVDAGDILTGTNDQTYLSVAADQQVPLAQALEDGPGESEDPAPVWVLFHGISWSTYRTA